MEMRQLGRSGLSVPSIIFGGNVFGWTVDQPHAFRLLDTMVAAGLTAIDSADVYSAWAPGQGPAPPRGAEAAASRQPRRNARRKG